MIPALFPAGGPTPASALGLMGVLAVGLMVAFQPRAAGPGGDGPGPAGCQIPGGGHLRGEIFGDVELRLQLRDRDLHCEGMLRPDGGGLRLMFAGIPPGGRKDARIVVVMALDGQLAGLGGGERPANVTVIDERDGRFYSARGPGRCFSAVRSAEPLPGTRNRQWRVEGELYCAGALPSLQDMASITLGTLYYAGRLDVDES